MKFFNITRRREDFQKILLTMLSYVSKKNSFKYKKYIREFQKKLTESKKSYPHNKKYFDLTSKKL